jgi:hypothetical protein
MIAEKERIKDLESEIDAIKTERGIPDEDELEKILKQLNERLSCLSGNIGNIKFDNLHFLKRVKYLETLYEEIIIKQTIT